MGNPAQPTYRAAEFGLTVDAATQAIVEKVTPFTLTSPERLVALCDAVRYLARHDIPGDIVECGAWKGGSMMAAALSLIDVGPVTRTLWVYDTFDGMTEPTAADVDLFGQSAIQQLRSQDRDDPNSLWARVPMADVERAIASTGYPRDRLMLVEGRVEDTVPAMMPEAIALLRLDTDWYASTLHELRHLVPRLVPGGVLIVDDYGHWNGARRAVDEYFAVENPRPILLNRIDYTGRIAVL